MKYYFAHISFERVVDIEKPIGETDSYGKAKMRTVRRTTELANITSRNDDLEGLKTLVAKHIELIEDITATDERKLR